MNALEAQLLTHAGATWFMCGLAWFVQLVHYPLMAQVGQERWVAYAAQHTRRTTWVVAPAMSLEALLAVSLLFEASVPRALAWTGLVLLIVVWGSTCLLQVPMHARLARGFDTGVHAGLVRSSWLRTSCWSLRALTAAWMLAGSR